MKKKSKISEKHKRFLDQRRKRINMLLQRYLNALTKKSPRKLATAMKYGVLNGGKRLRPLLVYAVGDIYGASLKSLDPLACAIELMHSFSLVHDDLPAMDNDDLRRGKPACHVAFDEATAILAGDALSVAAFQLINDSKFLSSEKKSMASRVLAEASGAEGMAAGQYMDMQSVGKKLSLKKLKELYLLKTGCLLRAAVRFGVLAADSVGKNDRKSLDNFAFDVGLAFQIMDDVLNIEGDVKKLGKGVGTDKERNTITYPALVGINKARLEIDRLWDRANMALGGLKADSGVLHYLTQIIMLRDF